MSRIPSAPGSSIAAQFREARAQLRRALRLEIRDLETRLAEKKDKLRELELERNGRRMLADQKKILPGGAPAKP